MSHNDISSVRYPNSAGGLNAYITDGIIVTSAGIPIPANIPALPLNPLITPDCIIIQIMVAIKSIIIHDQLKNILLPI